ncbi:MAG UNVERIFIED_CONTAM: hypothetical protein LVR18_05340 [Planctomycetaceae bacterium]
MEVSLSPLASSSSWPSPAALCRDLFGYARATADTTVAELETSLPDAVRDQKVRNQLEDARGELIDRRVSLSLATGQIQDLTDEIARLKSAIARRETILADAWPAMESAAADRAQPVVFAGTSWQPADLSAEVDRLLSEQDRDEVQLQVRSEALERLQASVSESQAAVSEMESRLQKAGSDFDLLEAPPGTGRIRKRPAEPACCRRKRGLHQHRSTCQRPHRHGTAGSRTGSPQCGSPRFRPPLRSPPQQTHAVL